MTGGSAGATTEPGYRVVTHAEQPELVKRWGEYIADAWPELLRHDPICNRLWHCLFERHPDCQLYLLDRSSDQVVGIGNTVPVAWDGTVAGLPGGIDDMMVSRFESDGPAAPATALSALQAVVVPTHQGRGLSGVILSAMRDMAVTRGFSSLIAPVRPTWKCRYPLTPMDRYMRWVREDGLPLDPWLRVHRRLGAEIVRVAERSMVVTGTVAEWEAWAELAFPDSGEYVVPGALVPVQIDRERDEGRYVEPNVWMRHPVA